MEDMRITIKACRVNTGMNQREFADAIGVHLNTIYNWEKGKGEPTLSQLRKISEVSTVPMGSIIVGSDSFTMNQAKGDS